ncbi:MAG: hypothetical protein ISS44_02235, partial [Candidatus Omnitrophica bacterium]|nr:hypothetical protein [Candidatus Omnitrophota bacterium]
TTYYPSPYGDYNELTTHSNTNLATDDGNVGIGTTSPGAKLEIDVSTDPGESLWGLHIKSDGADSFSMIKLENEDAFVTAAPYWRIIHADNGNLHILKDTNHGITIDDRNANVGIGTMSPDEKLHLVGSIKIVDGNQGADKVLTSDANGVASWQDPSGVPPGGIIMWSGALVSIPEGWLCVMEQMEPLI